MRLAVFAARRFTTSTFAPRRSKLEWLNALAFHVAHRTPPAASGTAQPALGAPLDTHGARDRLPSRLQIGLLQLLVGHGLHVELEPDQRARRGDDANQLLVSGTDDALFADMAPARLRKARLEFSDELLARILPLYGARGFLSGAM